MRPVVSRTVPVTLADVNVCAAAGGVVHNHAHAAAAQTAFGHLCDRILNALHVRLNGDAR
jgi:hypothetical protein